MRTRNEKKAEVLRSARFNVDRSKRWELIRDWRTDPVKQQTMNLIMLNPSKAGEKEDDPTVRKGIGFATRWGYYRLIVTNLTAHVSTDPEKLPYWSGLDTENLDYLDQWIRRSDLVVAAWGSQPKHLCRRIALPELVFSVKGLMHASNQAFHCIGVTKWGAPLHPSRAPYTSAPTPWIDLPSEDGALEE